MHDQANIKFTISFFFCFVHRLNLKNTTFRNPAMFPSSGKEAPNVVDPLNRAILRHWAP